MQNIEWEMKAELDVALPGVNVAGCTTLKGNLAPAVGPACSVPALCLTCATSATLPYTFIIIFLYPLASSTTYVQNTEN